MSASADIQSGITPLAGYKHFLQIFVKTLPEIRCMMSKCEVQIAQYNNCTIKINVENMHNLSELTADARCLTIN